MVDGQAFKHFVSAQERKNTAREFLGVCAICNGFAGEVELVFFRSKAEHKRKLLIVVSVVPPRVKASPQKGLPCTRAERHAQEVSSITQKPPCIAVGDPLELFSKPFDAISQRGPSSVPVIPESEFSDEQSDYYDRDGKWYCDCPVDPLSFCAIFQAAGVHAE
jgi:hypothetical protein